MFYGVRAVQELCLRHGGDELPLFEYIMAVLGQVQKMDIRAAIQSTGIALLWLHLVLDILIELHSIQKAILKIKHLINCRCQKSQRIVSYMRTCVLMIT